MISKSIKFDNIALLWAFYLPAIKVHLTVSVIVIILSYVIQLCATFCEDPGFLYSVGSMIVYLPYYTSPLVFAHYSDRAFTIALPATGNEKALFALIYSFVVSPLVIAAAWYLSMGVASVFTENYDVLAYMVNWSMRDMADHGLDNVNLMSLNKFRYFGEMMPTMVALYVALSVKRSAEVFTILSLFITLICTSMLGGLYGIVIGIQQGFADAVNGVDPNPDVIARNIVKGITDFMPIVAIISLLVDAVVLCMIFRKSNRIEA